MMKLKREAFSMITAIFMMVMMAGVSALVMGTAGKIIKQTTHQYQKEQAILLAKSYTEFAIMAVSANDRSINCLNTINGSFAQGGGYTITTEISYIGDAGVASCSRVLSSTVTTTNSPLNIIIDIYVKYQEIDNPTGHTFTYHRRTLQKI